MSTQQYVLCQKSRQARLITSVAFKMCKYIMTRNKHTKHQLNYQRSIHISEVIGDLVGRLNYVYDVFGDGANTASRMETKSESMKINSSPVTQGLLPANYHLEDRGLIPAK